MKVALEKLGYKDVYHMTSILTQNPKDADLWKRAYDAVYGGKGKWGKKEWDALLGHCMVRMPDRREILLLALMLTDTEGSYRRAMH